MEKTPTFKKIASELGLKDFQVKATAELLSDGATIPFIARYRKEITGSLDEVQIADIRDRIEKIEQLEKRRAAILQLLDGQNILSEELKKQIHEAHTLSELEDLYLPYKPKRKTRASVARERGLQALADLILSQRPVVLDECAQPYFDESRSLISVDDVLSGARDIIAEQINENAEMRARMRELFWNTGFYRARVIEGKEAEGQKYKDYFDWTEPVKTAPSHRVLAMRRAEKELIITLDIDVPADEAIGILKRTFVIANNESSAQVEIAAIDSYKRLIKPSIETEIRLMGKKNADAEAIRVFAGNARQLLLAPPAGQLRVLAIDPGFRTGCKVVCLDEQGSLSEHLTIYPHNGDSARRAAAETLRSLVKKHNIQAVAIGNGTAGRETESFVRELNLNGVAVVMVNESGASIYSASEVAREEFPDKDITVRGAVSIGRRLMDPLAELVKIDPKSIGVGQYQHDVDQASLQRSLDDTVASCVNAVGVELNTASPQILAHISGLGQQLAKNIVEHRKAHGPFRSRTELRNVQRMGDKAFEQAAGFLRIRNADNPLDGSAVHPERYPLVERIAKDLGSSVEALIKDSALRSKIRLEKYVDENVGMPTLQDIMDELSKPGRDPREKFEVFAFEEGINAISDLKPGLNLPGIVTNITAFGAFVDIGVHQDGLVHLSQISDRFIKDANEVLKVGQRVRVTVADVDIARKRISLTMKGGKSERAAKKETKPLESLNVKLDALKQKFSS